MAVNLHLTHFRFGKADGTESTHTWWANIDTVPTTIPVDTNFLLRIGIQQVEATAAANLAQQFQYNLAGAGWVDITTSSAVVKAITPSTFANNANSTNRLGMTGSGDASNANCTTDGSSGGTANDVPASGFSETVCGLYINSGTVTHGQTIQFRVTVSGPTTTITYDITPSLTVYEPVAPTVTTQDVDTIAEETATGHGTVTADGGAAVTERGVCWKTSTGPTTADSKATSGTGTGTFAPAMTGLAPTTHYYVKAYAINSVGTSYGAEVEFDTLNWAVRLKLSDDIPAGGATATTRQLATPGGKAVGDFEAGTITDNVNPLASFNPGADKFSDWEVCVEVIDALTSADDEIEFRLTNNGTVLDSYTRTPKWIIGAGATIVTIDKTSLVITAKAVTTNAKVNVLIEDTSLILTGKAFTVNQKTSVPIAVADPWFFIGFDLGVNAKENIVVAKTSIIETGKPFYLSDIILITPASIVLTGHDISFTANIIVDISPTSILLTSNSVNANQQEKILIDDTSILFSPQAFVINMKENVGITSTSILLTGQNFNTNAKVNIVPTTASIILTGQAVSTTANTNVDIGDGSILISPQNFISNMKTNVLVEDGSIIISPKTLFATERITPGAGSIILSGQNFNTNEQNILSISSTTILINGQPFVVIGSTVIPMGSGMIIINGKTVASEILSTAFVAHLKHRLMPQLLINKIMDFRRHHRRI